MRARLLPALTIATAVLVLAAPGVFALEDLAAAMPEDTAIYARAAGLETLLGDLASTRLLADGASLRAVFEVMLAKAWPAIGEESGVPGDKWKELVNSLKGVHLGLLKVGQSVTDSDYILVAETEKPEIAREVLDKFFEKTMEKPPAFAGEVGGARVMQATDGESVNFYYAILRNYVAVAVKPERITFFITAVSTGVQTNLAATANYRTAALPADAGATCFAYFDAPRCMDMLKAAMGGGYEQEEGDDEFSMMRQVAGLDQLVAASMMSTGGLTRARLVATEQHRWLAALRGTPGPCALQAYVPEGCAIMVVDCGSIEKKAAALRDILLDKEAFPFAGEVEGDLKQAEEMIGMPFLELAKTLGNEWAFFWPMAAGASEPEEEGVTFALQIGDRAKFDAAMSKFMESPLAKEMGGEEGGIAREAYAGVEIVRPGGDSPEVPCMAVAENVLLLSGDVRALKASLDAKASGRNFLARSGPFMPAMSGTVTKLAAMPLSLVLMDENDFTPLLDMVADGATWILSTDEAPGRVEATFNQSMPALVGMLMGASLMGEVYSDQEQQCLANLRAIGEAITAYRAKNNAEPPSIEALAPDFLGKNRLACPFASAGEACSYKLVPPGEEPGEYDLCAYCTHRLHGRLVLRRGGEAWSTREGSFLRELNPTR